MSEFLRDVFPWVPAEWLDWLGFALIALGLLLVIVLLWRMVSGPASRARRASEARLAVVEAAEVDQRRRLVLVRRDDVEHLVMIGGPSDVVIEPNIGSAPRAAQAVRPVRPAPQPAPQPVPRGATPVEPRAQAGFKRTAAAEPVVPPRIAPASVDVPKGVESAPAAPGRREPAFTRTAGPGADRSAQPSPEPPREADVIDLPRPVPTPERGASVDSRGDNRADDRTDNRDTDALVAEIDEILNRPKS